MKKRLQFFGCLLMLIFLVETYVLADNTLKIGYNFSGIVQDAGHTYSVLAGGADLGYEYRISNDQFEAGIGVEYQMKRCLSNDHEIAFCFTPVYGVISFQLTDDPQWQSYITTRFGYNFLNGNENFRNSAMLTGGLYYAVGLDMKTERLITELLYSKNDGSRSIQGISSEIYYSTWSVKVGYFF